MDLRASSLQGSITPNIGIRRLHIVRVASCPKLGAAGVLLLGVIYIHCAHTVLLRRAAMCPGKCTVLPTADSSHAYCTSINLVQLHISQSCGAQERVLDINQYCIKRESHSLEPPALRSFGRLVASTACHFHGRQWHRGSDGLMTQSCLSGIPPEVVVSHTVCCYLSNNTRCSFCFFCFWSPFIASHTACRSFFPILSMFLSPLFLFCCSFFVCSVTVR